MMVLEKIFGWFRKKQVEVQNEKIRYLYDKTYQYYLNQYLLKTVNDIDFPSFMYETGMIICAEAKKAAIREIVKVMQERRINECVKKYQKLQQFGKQRIK